MQKPYRYFPIFLICIFLFAGISCGEENQTTSDRRQLDSMMANIMGEIERAERQDRADIMLKRCNKMESLLTQYPDGMEKHRKLAFIYRKKASAFFIRGEYGSSLEILSRGIKELNKDDFSLRYEIYCDMANAALVQRNFVDAKRYIDMAEKEFSAYGNQGKSKTEFKQNDKTEFARRKFDLINIHSLYCIHTDKPDQAEKLLTDYIGEYGDFENFLNQCMTPQVILSSLCEVYRAKKDQAKSLFYAKAAYDYCMKNKSDLFILPEDPFIVLADDAINNNNYRLAEKYCLDFFSLDSSRNPVFSTNCSYSLIHLKLAQICRHDKRYEEMKHHAESVMKISPLSGPQKIAELFLEEYRKKKH